MSALPTDALAEREQVIADLQRQLAECKAERDEALERETATAEVLRVINSSPGDLAPVFEAILEKAHALCGAVAGSLGIFEGDTWRAVVQRGYEEPLASRLRRRVLASDAPLQELIDGAPLIHVADLAQMDHPIAQANVAAGIRALLVVALRKDDALLGTISIARREPRSFSDKQIALLQNFAGQAVIAMENARLLTETREALEQQTATAEVLQVINSSPGDLAPVFDAMLERATSLCNAAFGIMTTFDGERLHTVALHGVPQALQELLLSTQPQPALLSGPGRVLRGEDLVRTDDLGATPSYQSGDVRTRALVDLGGARTALVIALRRNNTLLGTFTIYRQEVRPFAAKEIALLQNFAAQAVIAIENARLLTETREALEQQTATAEVLQVINSSPGDLAPVFDSLLEKALRLCEAAFGLLIIWDGEQFHRVAFRGVPDELISAMQQPLKPVPGGLADRLVRGERIIAIPDLLQPGDVLVGPGAQLLVRFGARSYIAIALRKDEALLGGIVIYRREVRPFSETQIALLQNFAAQAVIAMENARLITETREALEQQTATAEVLQVINSSPGDLAPVFEAILEKALRLCEAAFGFLVRVDGEELRAVTMRNVPEAFADYLRQPMRSDQVPTLAGAIQRGQVLHVHDASDSDGYRQRFPIPVATVELGGVRTVLYVPLVKDGRVLGVFVIYRREVRPFSDEHIALVQNFAAQAVIAMENARLITETREALEQQTATAEVLQVINSSPAELAPVFDAILDKAHTLCGAEFGSLFLYDGEHFRAIASHGVPEALASRLRNGIGANDSRSIQQLIAGAPFVHIHDSALEERAVYRGMDMVSSHRTLLSVPLRKGDALLGMIVAGRLEVRPFTDKQIALLQNFAAQAVIAMENARLLTETREALEQQTATAEVLQVINSSPGDVQPTFDAIAASATRLCAAAIGAVLRFDGAQIHLAAHYNCSPAELQALQAAYPRPPSRGHVTGRAILSRTVAYVADIGTDPEYALSRVVQSGMHAHLSVPMLQDGNPVGAITLARREATPFSETQIELLKTFAAQAVIAMENARLIDEIRQRQQELRVTFDNMVDGVAMFDETLHLAAWNRNFQELLQLPDELLAQRHDFDAYIRYLTERGEFGETDPEKEIARLRARIGEHYSFERTRPDGTVIEVRHNPMPGGGIVLIYSDITERKRSEAEIKMARDAAEAAYRDLQAAQASLIQAEKMASLGQLTAGIAHEIKNPLNFVNNFAGLSVELLDELKETAAPAISALNDEKRAEIDETIDMLSGNLDKIAEHGRRADNIVTSMLEHSRGSSGERRLVDLNTLVEEALNLAYHGGRAQDQSFNITLERDYADAIAPIKLVPQDITRVCLNLFGNGFYAAVKRQKEGRDARFKPLLKVSTCDLGEAVEIRVRDNGIGIAPEIRDKLFQPFFTTKPSGEGTGLGLSISWDIVTQQHGGMITVDSREGEFTEFTVRLPRAYRATAAAAAS